MPWVPPTVAELAPAFPQLEIVELIGHGGMGAVYKARQKSLGRWVALKILAPQHASKADFAERFSREAQFLAEVNHPHIVTVHDFGQAGEFYFLLMEYVDGVSLRQAMVAGRLSPEQALAIVPPICEALQFAHERGIVHRDIKPENLLLDKEGRVKIADFGIARMMRAGDGRGEPESRMGNPARPTPAGSVDESQQDAERRKTDPSRKGRGEPVDLTQESVLGTPRYMAPEQRDRPASVDHRADIYSLGVVLYEMLTGELPGPSWQPPSRHSAADVRLDQIVQRALEQNPDLRYQSATELRTQIETTVSKLEPGLAEQLLVDTPSPRPSQRLSFDSLAEYLGVRTVWGRRFLGLSMLGVLGFLTALMTFPGLRWTPVHFGFIGFFAFIAFSGKATGLYVRHGQKLKDHWKLASVLGLLVITCTSLMVFAVSRLGIHAEVKVYDAKIDGSHFSFRPEIECPEGWNVWATVTASRAFNAPKTATLAPNQSDCFQAQLGKGRVRLPLRFLPATGPGIRSVTLPPDWLRYTLRPRHRFYLMSYSAANQDEVAIALSILPEGESPSSQGGLRFQTVDPPVKPKLGPFEAAFEQGTIELARLMPDPSDGKTQWMPNGLPCTETGLPESSGHSSFGGKVIKEITFRVQSNTRNNSRPMLRFPDKSGFSGMGSSLHRTTDEQPAAIMIQSIACPPEAREMTVEVGVADGEWKTEISFEPASYPHQRHYSLSTTGSSGVQCEGTVQITDAVGDKLPVSFSYTHRDDAETRLVYELADGTLVPMPDTSGLGTSRTGLMTIPVAEFETIKHFHVQSRRYQWVEFRNVSLEPGHQTQVEVQSAY